MNGFKMFITPRKFDYIFHCIIYPIVVMFKMVLDKNIACAAAEFYQIMKKPKDLIGLGLALMCSVGERRICADMRAKSGQMSTPHSLV